ncbi:PREDICTED: cyclin-dependent kinase 2-associated protein 1-like [Elephantulus edwardii]|uniref:cyclin-dependent kinase 2-associated protein 1-like n=1 Tax=Elephantulus edwardii TaxID=28737 RepID=UPI0003F06F8B|nr:PREDICTED: cyclin-dependent kinase 2-associated protein 1-like [Elephantulus edwardii]
MPAAALNAAGSVHSPSTSMAMSSQYRQLLSDYGPPSLGYTQGTGNSQVPQSKYAELLAIIEELGKEVRPTYADSKSAMERLKRGIIHARGLVRKCLAETERNHFTPNPQGSPNSTKSSKTSNPEDMKGLINFHVPLSLHKPPPATVSKQLLDKHNRIRRLVPCSSRRKIVKPLQPSPGPGKLRAPLAAGIRVPGLPPCGQHE